MIQGLVIPSWSFPNPQPNPQFVQLARQEPEHCFLAGRLAGIEIKNWL
jgi:hypothetical protein